MARTLAGINPTASISGSSLAGAGGGMTATQAQQIIARLESIDNRMANQGAGGAGNVNQYIGPNTFSSVANAQQLYNLLNSLAGSAFEGGLRGAGQGLSLG